MGPNLRSVRPRRIETTLAFTSARVGPRPSLTISANGETYLETHAGVTMRPVLRERSRGETRDPDDPGLWQSSMRLGGAPGSAGERAVFVVHAECCQESDAWAVSLRAAQLPAGDSFTRRRSVAPLGASLAFGEIASGRSRARPTEPARSTEPAPRQHARPRKGSRVQTHPLSSCIAARARPSPPRLPLDLALCPGRASCGITSTRLAREPMAGDSGARSAETERLRCRPTSTRGVGLRFGRRSPKVCVEHLFRHSLVAPRDENSKGPDCRVRQRIRSALSRAERCAFARRSGLRPT